MRTGSIEPDFDGLIQQVGVFQGFQLLLVWLPQACLAPADQAA